MCLNYPVKCVLLNSFLFFVSFIWHIYAISNKLILNIPTRWSIISSFICPVISGVLTPNCCFHILKIHKGINRCLWHSLVGWKSPKSLVPHRETYITFLITKISPLMLQIKGLEGDKRATYLVVMTAYYHFHCSGDPQCFTLSRNIRSLSLAGDTM